MVFIAPYLTSQNLMSGHYTLRIIVFIMLNWSEQCIYTILKNMF